MVHDNDHIEARCVCYVEIGMHSRLEQSKICALTVTALGIAMLTVHHDMTFSVSFRQYPRRFLRQT